MPNMNVSLSTDIHYKVKMLAQQYGGMGGAIRHLLRIYEGHPTPTPERVQWTEALLKAVHQGHDADQWIAENPAPPEPERLDLTGMLHG